MPFKGLKIPKPTANPKQIRKILLEAGIGMLAVVFISLGVYLFEGHEPEEHATISQDVVASTGKEESDAKNQTTSVPGSNTFPTDTAASLERQKQELRDKAKAVEYANTPKGYGHEDPNLGVIDADDPPGLIENGGESRQLYCGAFMDVKLADEAKAKAAMVGINSKIARFRGMYILVIGPYKNRELATADFNKLHDAEIFDQCTLYGI
ncbi:MAG: SPOR domain-containing protein [Succinivibrio sp.]|nr:SPOR domain-containing protein [Succinivibrio sp.]